MVLINLHRNLHEKSSFLSEIMFIRINPYLCHLLTRYQSTIFPNHKSCVRKKGVPEKASCFFASERSAEPTGGPAGPGTAPAVVSAKDAKIPPSAVPQETHRKDGPARAARGFKTRRTRLQDRGGADKTGIANTIYHCHILGFCITIKQRIIARKGEAGAKKRAHYVATKQAQ